MTDLVLNDDGTVKVTVKNLRVSYFTLGGTGRTYVDYTVTGGHWYKIKGKGHSFYLDADITATVSCFGPARLDVRIPAQIVELNNSNGRDTGNQIAYGYKYGSFTGSAYNSWDAGYATMSIPADSLVPFIDACVPADVARPYIDKGYTGEQAVPYICYHMPLETADYFKNRGISGDLCGPYYAAGVSNEDIIAYLDSGFTADQIMPFVKAGVSESDVLTYLDAGYTYDMVRPFVDAKMGLSDIMAYMGANIAYDHARPYIDAGVPASIAIPYVNSAYTTGTEHAFRKGQHKHHQSQAIPATQHTVGPGYRLCQERHFGDDGKALRRRGSPGGEGSGRDQERHTAHGVTCRQ